MFIAEYHIGRGPLATQRRRKVMSGLDAQKARIEASKAAGRADNYEGGMPHSAVGGRNDAAWSSVTSGGTAGTNRRGSVGAHAKDLRGDLDAQQLNTFTRWWNSHLALCDPPLKVEDLLTDIQPGVLSIRLLEVLSQSSCGKFAKKPIGKFQKLENHNIFLGQLKARNIRLVNIGAEDLMEGDLKLVLGLTWTLILRYEIHEVRAPCDRESESCRQPALDSRATPVRFALRADPCGGCLSPPLRVARAIASSEPPRRTC